MAESITKAPCDVASGERCPRAGVFVTGGFREARQTLSLFWSLQADEYSKEEVGGLEITAQCFTGEHFTVANIVTCLLRGGGLVASPTKFA